MNPGSTDTILSLNDLKPAQRLNNLFEISATSHVDPSIGIKTYFDLAASLLVTAKVYQNGKRNELALLSYLRYQALIKKIKKHPRCRDIPIGKRSAFDYKLKAVAKEVKELTEKVFAEYEKFYNLSKIGLQLQDSEGNQEQRPTISTIRTFVSGQPSVNDEDRSKRLSQRKLSTLPLNIIRGSMKSSNESLPISTRSKSDTLFGIRKSIFPTSQVREFESLHRQRRIVRSHRTLKIPSRITTEFSYLSFKTMKKNIETVGYLAGAELNDQELQVTHLVLPEQFGYSDFFKVKDSHLLIRYLEQNDLMILGWIHSHPVEKPYLSSSDMHYQSIFQSVLPEAVAVVYSPKEMKSAIFNLTPDHGLNLILNCRKKGFHVHPTNPAIYMVSQHAIIDLYGDLIVKDFRNSRRLLEAVEESKFHGDLFERTLNARNNRTSRYRKSEVIFVHVS